LDSLYARAAETGMGIFSQQQMDTTRAVLERTI
jgi:hypothetical protein